MLLIVLPITSAFEFDNIKGELQKGDGISEYGKIEIRNSILGIDFLQLDKIVELELKTNTEICNMMSCSAEKEIIMYEDGRLIDAVRFLDLKTNRYRNIENYQFYINQGGRWEEYNYEVMPGNGDGISYEVKLEGTINFIDDIDWQIKSQGIWITEWARWRSSYNDDLLAYWDMSNDTVTNVPDLTGNGHPGTINSTSLQVHPAHLGNGLGTVWSSVQFVNITNGTGLNELDSEDQEKIKEIIYNHAIELEREIKTVNMLRLHFKIYNKGGRKKY